MERVDRCVLTRAPFLSVWDHQLDPLVGDLPPRTGLQLITRPSSRDANRPRHLRTVSATPSDRGRRRNRCAARVGQHDPRPLRQRLRRLRRRGHASGAAAPARSAPSASDSDSATRQLQAD